MSDEKRSISLDEGILVCYLILAFAGYSLFFTPWITGDGLSYFAYLRSMVIDNDLDFKNEFTVMSSWRLGEIQDLSVVTDTGRHGNRFSIGPAILWSPFYTINQMRYHNISSKQPNAGYSKWSIKLVGLATLLYSFVGLLLLDNILEKMFSKGVAFITTISIWFSSPLLFYMYHEPSTAHGVSFFTTTLFVYYWYTSRDKKGWKKHTILGLSGGLMMLIRWQNALFLLLPIYDLVRGYLADKDKRRAILLNACILTAVALIVFSPQIFAWKIIYGKWFTVPQGGEFFDLLHPKILQILFSPKHGLLSWTPIYALSFAGFYFLYRKDRNLAKPLLLVLALNILFNSFMVSWHGHWAFGARRLVNCIPLFAIGLGGLLSRFKDKILLSLMLLILFAFILWNVLLMTQVTFKHTLISHDVPFSTLIEGQRNAVEQLRELIERKLL